MVLLAEGVGTTCLWCPEIEATSVFLGVPRCTPCATIHRAERATRLHGASA